MAGYDQYAAVRKSRFSVERITATGQKQSFVVDAFGDTLTNARGASHQIQSLSFAERQNALLYSEECL
jgi:hypothetical protein